MSDPQEVRVPLTEYAKTVARTAAWEVIKEHRATCDLGVDMVDIKPRVSALEKTGNYNRGFIAGIGAACGLLGGGAVYVLERLLK